MQHQPTHVLEIGELALFIIGAVLSLVLLAILLLPSLLRFKVPHWVEISLADVDALAELDRSIFWESFITFLRKKGYRVSRHSDKSITLTRDQATFYDLLLLPHEDPHRVSLSMFRRGDEVSHSAPTSILAGAGIGWIAILCHQYAESQNLKPKWGWDQEYQRSGDRPFNAIMHQLLLFNPWR